ncbi:MAG TPA: glycoside hydrolase family 3 N-terminal domain-containing protein, partial [Thermoleophilaceae bacterium]
MPARRRLMLLALAAVIALIVGVAIGAGAGDGESTGNVPAATTPGQRAQRSAERLPLRAAVGQVLISSFDGTSAPDYIRRRLRERQTAGVILFGQNASTRTGFRVIGRAVQGVSGRSALVAVDQEGGEIRILPFAPPVAAQPQQGPPAAVRRQARAAGRSLRAAGVNVNLAPVADVAVGPTAALAGRAFPGDAEAVSARVRASVRGLHDAGVAATAKHFPGLGGAVTNTDDGPATVDLLEGELERRDLPPFRAAIAAHVPLIMLSHALYPATDRHHIASQSHAIATDLLRDELGFDGVTVTDSIEAQAVLDRSGVATAAERSLAAGADLILMTGSGSWNQVYPRLLARARRDPTFRAQVR